MFITTRDGRLQNLTLLQTIRPVEDDDHFAIGYVQINGEIIKEGSFSTLEEAQQEADTRLQELM